MSQCNRQGLSPGILNEAILKRPPCIICRCLSSKHNPVKHPWEFDLIQNSAHQGNSSSPGASFILYTCSFRLYADVEDFLYNISYLAYYSLFHDLVFCHLDNQGRLSRMDWIPSHTLSSELPWAWPIPLAYGSYDIYAMAKFIILAWSKVLALLERFCINVL
jgi:hypothetical protein